MEDDVVGRLQQVGMSLYDARIYVGLLRHGSQNGNELAKNARVPSSKVYAALEKLELQGIVHSVRRGSGTQFVCVAPSELVYRLRARYNEPIDFLEATLPDLASPEPIEDFLKLSGTSAVVATCRALVSAAAEEIHLSCWADELALLRDELAAASARGVRIFGMVYGDGGDRPAGTWMHHHYEDIVRERIGGRMLTLSVDHQEAVAAWIPPAGNAAAVRTKSPVLTLIVEEYLHHDMVLQRAQELIGFERWDEWWQADSDLRTIILSRGVDAGARAGLSGPAEA